MLPQFKYLHLISTEPILQWTLGRVLIKNEINSLYPHVIDLKVTKCPCANDVALLGFVLNTTYNGKFTTLLNVRNSVLHLLKVLAKWQYKLNVYRWTGVKMFPKNTHEFTLSLYLIYLQV